MSNYQDIFDANKELSADECTLAIYTSGEGELTIKEAQAEYNAFAIEAGLVETPVQKKVKFEDYLQEGGFDLTDTDVMKSVKAKGDEFGIGSATVTKYIKIYATDNGIELPVAAPRTSAKWDAVIDGIDKDDALTGDRETIVARINELGEFDDIKKAGANYNKLRKHYGWEAPASMSSQLQDFYIANPEATDKEIADAATEIGMSERSVQYYKSVFAIVRSITVKLAAE